TIWRVKRGDPPVAIGACHVTIKGVRINLGTQDPDVARQRRREAMAGHRRFAPDASMRKPRAARAATDSGSTGGAAAHLLAALAGAAPMREGEAPGGPHPPSQSGSNPDPATAAAAPAA